jgi:hypothetical protein
VVGTVTDKNIVFHGCNVISIPCQAAAGLFKIFGSIFSTTKRACDLDNDNKYTDILKQANGYIV